MGAPAGGAPSRCHSLAHPLDVRRQGRPGDEKPGRCTAVVRARADHARSVLSITLSEAFRISFYLSAALQRLADHRRRADARTRVAAAAVAGDRPRDAWSFAIGRNWRG